MCITIFAIVFVILFFNLLMRFAGWYEKRILIDKDRWISTSQVLIPEKKITKNSVILVHGFTGSPYDMKRLALKLFDNGFRTVVPIMEGQTCITPLYQRGNYKQDYYVKKFSKIIAKEIELTGEKPFLVGFSMGGALSTILARQYDLQKIVLIAPFYGLTQAGKWIWNVTWILSYLLPYVPKFSKGKINSIKGLKSYYPGSYIISLKAFNNLGDMVMDAKRHVDQVKMQTLIFLSRNDKVASSNMTMKLFQHKSNTKIIGKNKANHILLYDHKSDQLNNSVIDFLLSE